MVALVNFLSNSTQESCRADDRNLLQEAQEKFGWDVIHGKDSRQKFDALKSNVDLPLMALFAPNVS